MQIFYILQSISLYNIYIYKIFTKIIVKNFKHGFKSLILAL